METVDREILVNTAASYRFCHQLTRRTAKNFYPGFLVLPRPQRRGMEALYAFMRLTDDLADEPGEQSRKRAELEEWERQLHEAVAGQFTHPIHAAIADTIHRWHVPVEYLQLVIEGVLADQQLVQVPTFAELYRYCYRVASVVGLSSVHIWGYRDETALPMAEAAGIAFQLTNILRDLREDQRNGRVYLPANELAEFQCPPDEWQANNPRFLKLMDFQIDRAMDYYRLGRQLRPLLSPAGRGIFSALIDTYQGLLKRIARDPVAVLRERVRVPTWQKLVFLGQAFPRRWGWR